MALTVKQVATQASDGTFSVRTDGLAAHGHPELEITGLPRELVEAAAKLSDYVLDAVIGTEGSKLKAGENVGLPLSIAGHEEIPSVFLGVHAIESEAPSGGFFARLGGSAKRGVLRLVDLLGDRSGAPLGAIASMMLYRSSCRFVTGDVEGAIAELRTSLSIVSGEPASGPPPAQDTDGAELNWQNTASYKRLAELVPAEADAILEQLYGRFEWLAQRDLGGTLPRLAALDTTTLEPEAAHIIEHSRSDAHLGEGPSAGLRLVASPIWSVRGDVAVRELSLIPAAFVSYYFGPRLADPAVAARVAKLAAEVVARYAKAPWKLLPMTALSRQLYVGSGAPVLPVDGMYGPATFLLSAVCAETTRFLVAGADEHELRAAFELVNDRALFKSLAQKLGDLDAQEMSHYMTAFS